MSLVKWNDRPQFPSVTNMFKDFFADDDLWRPMKWQRMFNTPAVNIKEMDDKFMLEFAIPGLEREDITVEVKDNSLIIFADKEVEKEEMDDEFTMREYNYQKFSRSFWLPENVKADDIKATYKKGILKVTVPKMEPTPAVEKVKKIEVS